MKTKPKNKMKKYLYARNTLLMVVGLLILFLVRFMKLISRDAFEIMLLVVAICFVLYTIYFVWRIGMR